MSTSSYLYFTMPLLIYASSHLFQSFPDITVFLWTSVKMERHWCTFDSSTPTYASLVWYSDSVVCLPDSKKVPGSNSRPQWGLRVPPSLSGFSLGTPATVHNHTCLDWTETVIVSGGVKGVSFSPLTSWVHVAGMCWDSSSTCNYFKGNRMALLGSSHLYPLSTPPFS